MKRLLVLACAGAAAMLALHHPAPAPALVPVAPPSQHLVKGHPSPPRAVTSLVYVVGAVAHPGLYRVKAGARIYDAIERAGGLRVDADPAAVNLAERVSDGEEIHVLRLGESAPPVRHRTTRVKRKSTRRAQLSAQSGEAPIDVNAADEAALAALPEIGPTLAARIVAYRRLNGPFASLDELADVAGMSQRRIDAIAQYASVKP